MTCDFIEVIPTVSTPCAGEVLPCCLDDNMELGLCDAHREILKTECHIEVLRDHSDD